MADKLSTAIPKIAKLLRVFCSPDATEGEWNNAYTLFAALLQEVDPGGHEITRRIERRRSVKRRSRKRSKPRPRRSSRPAAPRAARKRSKSRNRGVVALASLGQLNTGSKGINGYGWREIVGHCLANKHRIHNEWETNFIESVAGQMISPYFKPVGKTEADRDQDLSAMVQRENIGATHDKQSTFYRTRRSRR